MVHSPASFTRPINPRDLSVRGPLTLSKVAAGATSSLYHLISSTVISLCATPCIYVHKHTEIISGSLLIAESWSISCRTSRVRVTFWIPIRRLQHALHTYSKDDYHVVVGDIMFNFEDYAIQSYVLEIGF